MSGLVLQFVGVVLLNLYALALVLLRAPVFHTRLYRPMVLNIALSIAPAVVLVLTVGGMLLVAVVAPNPAALWAVVVVGGALWLLLLPNSAYLITELNFSHRHDDDPVPLWYDIVLVLTLALSGVMNTLLSLTLAQAIYLLVAYPNDDDPVGRPDSWALASVVLVLVTFGMYLGRYIRFNSWDIRHPVGFARKLVGHFRERGRARTAAAFVGTHSLLLAIVYLLVVAPLADVL